VIVCSRRWLQFLRTKTKGVVVPFLSFALAAASSLSVAISIWKQQLLLQDGEAQQCCAEWPLQEGLAVVCEDMV
jgi:hypothetical protein